MFEFCRLWWGCQHDGVAELRPEPHPLLRVACLQLKVAADTARFMKQTWTETIKYPWQTFKDPDVRRQFKKLSVLGAAALPKEKFERVSLGQTSCALRVERPAG